jgi:succinate dehydrogenase / fumarate reductase flavoprotein subunit
MEVIRQSFFGGTLVLDFFMQKVKQDNNCFRSLLSNEPSDRSNKMHHRHEMLDLVIVDGKARGIIARNFTKSKDILLMQ